MEECEEEKSAAHLGVRVDTGNGDEEEQSDQEGCRTVCLGDRGRMRVQRRPAVLISASESGVEDVSVKGEVAFAVLVREGLGKSEDLGLEELLSTVGAEAAHVEGCEEGSGLQHLAREEHVSGWSSPGLMRVERMLETKMLMASTVGGISHIHEARRRGEAIVGNV